MALVLPIGYYDDDRDVGFVLVSNGGIGGADPILVDPDGPRVWLETEHWDTMPILFAAAGRSQAAAQPGI